MSKTTEKIPTANPSAEAAAFVASLTFAQLRSLHDLDALNFRTWGDRRKPETLRHGLAVCLTRYPADLDKARKLAVN